MRMLVLDGVVAMGMGVGLGHGAFVRVPVMLVVNVQVLVNDGFVKVPMGVTGPQKHS